MCSILAAGLLQTIRTAKGYKVELFRKQRPLSASLQQFVVPYDPYDAELCNTCIGADYNLQAALRFMGDNNKGLYGGA